VPLSFKTNTVTVGDLFSPHIGSHLSSTRRDYVRYLDIISRAWGTLLVSELRPRHVIKLRDEWAETPVAANHLLSVLKTLIGWGVPREFSETNPCIFVPKLETDEEGAKPWPAWAYALINSTRAKTCAARSCSLATRHSVRPT